MLRITTRLAHSRALVIRGDVRKENELRLPSDLKQFILLPSLARQRFKGLLSVQEKLEAETIRSGINRVEDGRDMSRGIIACGLAYNYVKENTRDSKLENPVLKISQYPVPAKLLRDFVRKVDQVLVLEEGAPVVEASLNGVLGDSCIIHGRLDGTLPRDGELSPLLVKKALGLAVESLNEVPGVVRNRPPALCRGCSHIDLYNALNEALETYKPGRVFSDIGCYTLGALPPYNAINSCVDMGASVTMAKGASDAGLRPSVAVIGDSTFTHSGMTGLLDAVVEQTPLTVIISDNSTTAMTGGQHSHATSRLVEICRGIGVEEDHIRVMDPLRKHHVENRQIISEELDYEGVSVIISQRECIQTAKRRSSGSKAKTMKAKPDKV
jgi:indolepyruvate ferredoxin oxidoreductase alpha subunit